MGQSPRNVVLFQSINRINRERSYNAPYGLNMLIVEKESTRNIARYVRYISNMSTGNSNKN